VADRFELHALDPPRSNGLRLMQTLERLHSRLLIGAHHVGAFRREGRSLQIDVADLLDIGLVLLRRFALVVRRQPVRGLVWPKGAPR
jgi:hypothetical protein